MLLKVSTRTVANCRFLYIGKVRCKSYVVRKPVRVLNLPSTENVSSFQPTISEAKVGVASPRHGRQAISQVAVIEKPEKNVVPYEKLSKYDSRFLKTVQMIKDRRRREKSGKIILEGKRLINDAIKAGMEMQTLYFSREQDLVDIKLKDPEKVEVAKVLYKTLQVWSDMTTCPGVLAIFKRPSADEINVLSQATLPVTILCDNIREPGNLGSIIRNAVAAGCQNILLTKGCVDPWEVKVLRSGCGGHFRIPIVNNIEWSQISNYIPSNSTIFVADNTAEVEEVNFSSGFIDFVEPKETAEEEEEDPSRYVTFNEYEQPMHVDESFDSKSDLEKYEDVQLPCHLYTGIKYPEKNIVLYVGGETHGVSPKIIKLACEYGGKKIKIPMESGMDSINSAIAMTIILYEIKRQSTKLYITK